MVVTFLNLFAPIALTILLVGIGLKVGRILKALIMRRRFRGITPGFASAQPPIGVWDALKSVLIDPLAHFHIRANRAWS